MITYCDIDVYQHDTQLLKDGCWLNDSIVSYCLKSVERSLGSPLLSTYAAQNPELGLTHRIITIDASVVSYIRIQCEDDELKELGESLDILPDSSMIKWLFIPITNSDSFSTASAHWSLMLFQISDSSPTISTYHLDSCSGTSYRGGNYPACKAIVKRFEKILRRPVNHAIAIPSPQQSNSYDCGVFVVMYAEALARGITDKAVCSTGDKVVIELSNAVSRVSQNDALFCRRKYFEDLQLRFESNIKT